MIAPSTPPGQGWDSPPWTTCAAASNRQTRGHRDDPPYGIRPVLRRGAKDLTDHAWARLRGGIDAGDDHGQVTIA